MKFSLLAVGIVVIQIFSILNVSADSSTQEQMFTKIMEKLDSLPSVIKNVVNGKCDKTFPEPSGAVYVRWGNTDCPGPHTKIVYSGFAGGALFSQRGGAADYVCLPKNPTPSTDQNQYRYSAYMYGAEYQLFKNGGGSYPPHDLDVPCAVCQSMSRLHVLMLPGRDICPDGWHQEYRGHLKAGGATDENASQHVCVDNTMNTLHGGPDNRDGKLFYPVRAVCGSLRCPPYKNMQILTCAVCTR